MSVKIGDYELCSIMTGTFRLDGGAMFGVVPKVLWERTNPADEKNRISMALRALLIRGRGKNILVDSGVGEKWGQKQIEMFAIDHSKFQIDRSLGQVGLTREDITDVIISHLHFDHVGGATRREGEESVELAFPRATYFVQKENLDYAHAPTEKDRASFMEHTITPLRASGKLSAVSGNVEFAPGVSAWVTQGHTPGQQLVRVTDGSQTLLYCADTIPTASHIPLPYVMSFDLYPIQTLEEKREILERAVSEKWILFWDHDPFISACTAKKVEGRFVKDQEIVL